MQHTVRARSAAALVAAIALVAALLVVSPAEAAKRTKGRVNYGEKSLVIGGSYEIKGKIKSGKKRRVVLQVKRADGWKKVDKTRTRRKGKFRLAAPLNWYGRHKLRVFVPAKGKFRARAFKPKRFTVSTGRTAMGSRKGRTFTTVQGRRILWNPCRTIKYRINPGITGDIAVALTHKGMAEMALATGFRIKYLGLTSDVPLDDKKYRRKANLVVAWVNQNDYPEMAGAAGLGGGGRIQAVRLRSNSSFVWQIKRPGATLNESVLGYYQMTTDTPAGTAMPIGKVIVHEIGHAVGLGHTDDPFQMMKQGYVEPDDTGWHRSWYQAGDLTAMAQQGAKRGCHKPYRSARTAARGQAPTPSVEIPWVE